MGLMEFLEELKDIDNELIAYHGSKKKFKKFDSKKVGSNIGTDNFDFNGLFFSNDKGFAIDYATGPISSRWTDESGKEHKVDTEPDSGYVYTCRLNYKNPLVFDDKGDFKRSEKYWYSIGNVDMSDYDIILHKNIPYRTSDDVEYDKYNVSDIGDEYIVLDPSIIEILKTEHYDENGNIIDESY